MKVFIVGGTGLLGSAAAKELVARGHEVVSLSLPPLPEGAVFPPQMKIEYGNYLELSDEDFRAYFRGCDAFVFAAGVDERVVRRLPFTSCTGNTTSRRRRGFFGSRRSAA